MPTRQAEFGTDLSGPGVGAVPEPCSGILEVVAGMLFFGGRIGPPLSKRLA